QLAYLAMRAVCTDEVLSAQSEFRARLDISRDHSDARRIVPNADDLVSLENLRTTLPRLPPQDRLESGLGDEQSPARTKRFHALIQTADDVGEFSPRQAFHGDNRTIGGKLLLRLALDVSLDAGEAKKFKRPQVEVRSAGQRRNAAQSLNDEGFNAVLREEYRSGEAHESASGN